MTTKQVSILVDFTLEVDTNDIGKIYSREPADYLKEIANLRLIKFLHTHYTAKSMARHFITDYDIIGTAKIIE